MTKEKEIIKTEAKKPVAKKSTSTDKTAAVKKTGTKKSTSTDKTAAVKKTTVKKVEVKENKTKPVETVEVFESKTVQEPKVKKSKKKKEKLKLNFWKMTYMWFPMWNMMRKAKKISKKNIKSPGYFSEEYCYNFVKKAAKRILYVSDITVKCEGIENWLDRGVILAPNHQSNFDPVALVALNNFYLQQPLAFIAKKELWEDKKFGRFVRLMDCIPLDRKNPRSALEAFKEGKELVVDFRRSLAIFPEGTRSHSQEVGEFQPAALKVAQMANAPVVPVTIINSYQVFSKNRPKHIEIKVVFGKPIMPLKHISLKTEDLTKNTRKVVVENMEKWADKEMLLDHKIINKINLKNREDFKKSGKTKAKKAKDKKKIKDIFKVVD
ncbi:1-acyl-sn-glycerol-3-phosphate acyltransferase [Mesoplasma entomophilum]|uniref:1-acyl-sn-glycerol-3-phosphate acyltransferase n=1 Tax=Mesoplasma entomophilum TaxID=2149 RepID=A0A3S5XZW4_9MOLU|nr:1-acyl-sn-glycerol-3-phosphate acyltransferase [Mesoplasma entomophilum]ATQ35542.1 1-acyl-sn-glycerol-3-phosphate acyltransferase [Mesoplasma entomophilum]ATZ19504.1 1-acyl-sn-glycerol-3-phosphate acyltransferase [Mesoplasma entomophilum]